MELSAKNLWNMPCKMTIHRQKVRFFCAGYVFKNILLAVIINSRREKTSAFMILPVPGEAPDRKQVKRQLRVFLIEKEMTITNSIYTINNNIPVNENTRQKKLVQFHMTVDKIISGAISVDDGFYDLLWEAICVFQNVPFHRGEEQYTYSVRDDEMELNGLNKVFCRNAVNYYADKALYLRRHRSHVDRPERLGTIGAAYIYPVFELLGICTETTSNEPVFIGCRATV